MKANGNRIAGCSWLGASRHAGLVMGMHSNLLFRLQSIIDTDTIIRIFLSSLFKTKTISVKYCIKWIWISHKLNHASLILRALLLWSKSSKAQVGSLVPFGLNRMLFICSEPCQWVCTADRGKGCQPLPQNFGRTQSWPNFSLLKCAGLVDIWGRVVWLWNA